MTTSNFDAAAATAAYLARMSPEEHATAIAYTQGGHWLMLWGWLISLLVAWLIIHSGLLTGLRDRLERRRPRPVLVSFVVGLVYLLISSVLSLPWAMYSDWWREKAYGLNNQTWSAWLGENLMATAIMTLGTAAFLVALYALIRAARRTWWIWASGLTTAFIVLSLVVSPIAIEPLFNDYTPAPEGPVRDAVVELAERTGVPSDKIYIYDGSKQSDRYTANVSGLFGTARMAMSDSMFAQGADLAEVRAVMGHEMGHYARSHILWSVAVLTGLAVLVFWLTDRLYPLFRRLLGARREGQIADPAGLPVLGAVVSTVALLLTPAMTTLSRTLETDADRFSLEHAQEPDGLAAALIKTAEYRAPSPSRLEEILFYDHPSVERRIRRAMEWKAAHPEAATDGAEAGETVETP